MEETMYECREILNVSMDLSVQAAPSLNQIKDLQTELAKYPQIETEPEHYFADGMYGRALKIPGGSIVVGKIHKHEHLVLLLKGTVTINTDRGMETITGPHKWVSPAGAKRALYTHDECEFFTVHLNLDNERDLAKIEDEVIEHEDLKALFHDKSLSDFSDELQRAYA